MKIFNSTTCPTCTRAAHDPFRAHDRDGRVVNGCVDHFHTGHLVTPSESSFWHNRPHAKAIRAADRKARGDSVTIAVESVTP